MPDKNATIVIKRPRKAGGGHHGGSWKVAYADFVTAMMAFFLLMWLINTLPGEKKEGVAKYFRAPGEAENVAGGAGEVKSTGVIADREELGVAKDQDDALSAKERANAEEKQRLEQLKQSIEQAISNNAAIAAFKDQLIIDMTSEGLRIQLVDKANRPMFDLGGAEVKPYMRTLLREIAKSLRAVPNKVSIAGHTDAAAFLGRAEYGNWELSVDRANAARREMIMAGYPMEKFSRVIGMSSTVLYKPENPLDAMNRRTSIVVLTHEAADRIVREETGQGTDPSLIKDAARLLSNPAAGAKSAMPPGLSGERAR